MIYNPSATTIINTGGGPVEKISLTNRNTDIVSTNLSTNTPGLYRLSYYFLINTADVTAGTVELDLTFTDNATGQLVTNGIDLTVLGSSTSGNQVIQLASGSIAYSVTVTGAYNSAKYDLYLSLDRLI